MQITLIFFCFRVLRHISCAQAESALSAALGWHCAAHFLCLRRRVLPALLSARRVLLQRRASHSRALFSGVPFFSFLVDRELVLVLRARRFVVRSCSCVADGRRSRPRLRRRGPGRTTARWHTSSGGAYARRAAAHDGRPVSLFNVAATAELINCLVAKIEELQAENATLQEALRRVSKT